MKKVKTAVTDSGRDIIFDPDTKPGISNLLTMQQAIRGASMDELVAEYDGRGYGDLKKETAEIVISTISPIRERTNDYLADPVELHRLMDLGAAKAREAAAPTLTEVYQKVGFVTAR